MVFRGKSAAAWDVKLSDKLLGDYFATVPRTPRKESALGHPAMSGRRKLWHPISDTEVNSYLEEIAGPGFTAKDFRTWQGTATAATSLAYSSRLGATSPEAVTAAMEQAAHWLHNTPAIAKESYVDPRIVALFEHGKVAALDRQRDSAVLALLTAGTRAY